MMKLYFKSFIICILTFVFVGSLQAQYKKKDQVNLFGLSIMGGLNNSQIDGDFAKGFKKQGIYTGIAGVIRFSHKSQLEVGFVYSEKGSMWGSEKNGFETRDAATFTMDAIEIPISFKYFSTGPGSSIYWEGGIAIAQIVSKKLEERFPNPQSQAIFDELEEFYRKSELSLLGGLGVRFKIPLSVGLRFTTGLTHIMDKKLPPVLRSSDAREIGILRNYSIALIAGYEF